MSDEPETLYVEDEQGRIWRLTGPFVVLNPTVEYDPSVTIQVEELTLIYEPFSKDL